MSEMNTYHQLLSEFLTSELAKILKNAQPGHCLRLDDLPADILHNVCASLRAKKGLDAKVVLLSNHPEKDYEVSATKLIELRNLAEGAHVLLVLIPSNLRTAAEDSFDRATFKQIGIDFIPTRIGKHLEENLPSDVRPYYGRIKSFFENTGRLNAAHALAEYLIACQQNGCGKADFGRNLFHFGLIPDDALLAQPDLLEQRLHQNVQAVEYLKDERQTLISRIATLEIEPQSIQKPLFDFLTSPEIQGQPEDVKSWGALVAHEAKYAHLNLAHWPFTGMRDPQKLELFVHPLKGRNVTYQDGEKRLVTKENRPAKVTIAFETVPGPMEVDSLTHFQIHLMRTGDGGIIEKVETLTKFKKTAGRQKRRSKQISLNPAQFAEGVYFFRVLALDEAGTVLNRNDRFQDEHLQKEWEKRLEAEGKNASRDGLHGKLTCDSEDFYFCVEGSDETISEESDSTGRRTRAANLFQAVVRTRLDYLRANHLKSLDSLKIEERFWTDQGRGKRGECSLEVRFNDVRHTYLISLATRLRDISLTLLNAPDKLGTFRLDFSSRSTIERGVPHLRDNQLAGIAPAYFLSARKSVFEGILNQVNESGKGWGVAETCDWLAIAEPIENYLAAYNQWMVELLSDAHGKMDETTFAVIKKLQRLDFVEFIVPQSGGRREHVWVLTPLHPLRLAWFLQLQRLYLEWEAKSRDASKPGDIWTEEIQAVFLGGLPPTVHPLLIGGDGFRSFYYAGEMTPGWGVYISVSHANADDETSTARALLAQLQSLLGIPTSLKREADLSVRSLHRRIRRYLIQHPYVDVLHINVFNPGDGRNLIECLKWLQQEKAFDALRYEIRFIAPSGRIGEAGAALDEFLSSSGSISDEADAFLVPSRNPLFPKIRFSRNPIEGYQKAPEAYAAHLSLTFDLFPVEARLLSPKDDSPPSVFCHGLIVNPVNQVDFLSEGIQGWRHFLSLNETRAISETDSLADALIASLRNLQHLVAIGLAGKWTNDIPSLSMFLNDAENVRLYQIHESSDWVITIDRHLGIDFFDSPTHPESFPYLLDYSPGSALGEPPLFLTTRPHSEIYGLLMPHLVKLGLLENKDHRRLSAFLEALRSVSGSIIMQFTSSPTHAFEAIGIGLSRLLLEELNLLGEHLMIPLDAHRDLFAVAQKNSEGMQSRQRGDFLLISCDSAAEIIHIQAVEVKCRTHIGDGQGVADLKTGMTEQLDATVSALRFHFDPDMQIPDRLNRSLKNQQLFELLFFYLHRAKRYNLIRDEMFERWQRLLSRLHHGYQLSFNRIGLIFEFEGENEEVAISQEAEELVFFHAGRKTIEVLFTQLDEPRPPADSRVEKPLTSDLQTMRTTLTKERRTRLKPDEKPVPPEDKTEGEQTPEPKFTDQPATGTDTPKESAEVRCEVEATDEVEPVTDELTDAPAPEFTDLIGDNEESPQYGILAMANHRRVAIDLNGCNTISLFGVPGGGKSYTLGTIVEMAVQRIPGINQLPSPLATVLFHFNESQDYPPEFVSMRQKNTQAREVELLLKVYGAKPAALTDVLLLAPEDKVEARRQEYPDITVAPIAFSSQELSIKDWKFLMGAMGNQAMYIQHLNLIMRRGRNNLTLDLIRNGIQASGLSDFQKEYAYNRLELAAQFIDDSARLRDVLCPGRLVIVDLRDELIEKDQALGLFVVMLNIFAGAKGEDGSPFNKLIVFDEAHKYITHSDLTSHVVEVIRQMRHQGVTMLIASQDPPSLPNEVIELSSVILLHRFNSPQWLKHIQKSVTALDDLVPGQLAALQPGEAFIWANKATNPEWTKKAIKATIRPRVTRHGGSTQKAVE